MATALDQSTLQRTRDTLGKIIKKPALTDKLLSKPPFRYLHDIITEVNRATGFFKGLYSGPELDPKNIQDREGKIAFLQKAIDVLSFVQGDVVRVKSSKIVAGQEVEKTNEFLQLLSIAILKKLDSSEAVQKVLSGEKPVNKEKKRRGRKVEGEEAEKVEKRGRERGEEVRGEKAGEGEGKREGKQSHSKERPSEAKVRSHERSKERKEKEGKERKREVSEHEPLERPQHKPSRSRHEPAVREGRMGDVSGEDEGLGSETRLDRPRSARGHRRHVETGERVGEREGEGEVQAEDHLPETHPSQQSPSPPPPITHPPPPPMGLVAGKRPGSARPAPPRVVHHSSNDELSSRLSMETSVAPPPVILDTPSGTGEGGEEGEGEDEDYVVGNSTSLAPPTNEKSTILPTSETTPNQPEGVLTKTIVATKERLEGVGGREDGEGGEDIPGTITPAQRKREMEAVKKEMDKLREDIQLLCRYTNPMGRVMDYLQEDTDTMVQELERWRAENNQHREGLRREESITENELAPLRSQLEEIELRIQEQRDKISGTKANIIRQDNSIQQLLNSLKPHT